MDFINPCVCENYKCSCCAGIRVIGFGFDRRACADLTFDPKDSKLDFRFLLNNNTVFSNRFSTHNRQVCVPVIPITLAGPFDLCVRLYDMRVVEQRLHACLSMMARVSQYPIAVLQFNCMEMGPGGVGLVRPVGGNYNDSALVPPTTEKPQEDSDVFDNVTEANTSTEGYYLEFPSRS
ncbi:hypothetical protein O0L34_g9518 [Tuta absoluta]|nr:hypothetical protein O0L34_g9518 [Tuta absoluta]